MERNDLTAGMLNEWMCFDRTEMRVNALIDCDVLPAPFNRIVHVRNYLYIYLYIGDTKFSFSSPKIH